ncbi:uncharacterized protein LOC129918193 [Episyrphus balteatus]|nr:uncharacterized protein LOC129918193 [Episyrphus balteatus]
MYKKDYFDKMNTLLEDKNTYKTIRVDPTQKLQATNNTLVNELFKNEYIDRFQKNKLHCSASIAPRLYGLPKIHKPGLPLRPISSSMNVPCYSLSKYIGTVIRNIVSENYNIKNSFQLQEKLKDITLDDDDVMVSFDVISLFTNIPTYLAIKNILKEWNIIKDHTKIPKTKFLKLLEFCLRDNNYFQFDEKFYSQTYGMPMGNPLSPTVADIILDNLLDDTIEHLNKIGIKMKFIAKYVDDIFAIIKLKDIDTILNQLNSYHNKIQFTIENEHNNSLPYLDLLIHRENNQIIYNWYAKETASGRMINFHSNQPTKQKINTAQNFINKVLDLSDKRFETDNIRKIKTILKLNDYPNYIINNLFKSRTEKLKTNLNNNNNNNTITKSNNNTKKFFSVPYVPKLTDNRSLHQIIQKENISFAHKSNFTLKPIFTNTKSKIQKQQQHNVVYEIKCNGKKNENCDLVYIGQTKRNLATRLAEHEADIRKHKETTGLSQHITTSGHTVDFKNVTILDRERKLNTRLTLESLRIQQQIKRTMNTKEDTDSIKQSYAVAI